ncbi:hypothetical protein N9383_06335, partial [Granulosicoccus sp.]|nr:hypothetical protein [Granulosicoccus sp.]
RAVPRRFNQSVTHRYTIVLRDPTVLRFASHARANSPQQLHVGWRQRLMPIDISRADKYVQTCRSPLARNSARKHWLSDKAAAFEAASCHSRLVLVETDEVLFFALIHTFSIVVYLPVVRIRTMQRRSARQRASKRLR